ncbi:SDR family oxidoreductase [Ruegeria sp. SCP11]|uniref:SDR family oxidoreductase n=1 Tax=Ruegeria sp. SCP11 TaxID=3141378 RepID=UPI00333C16AA
MPKTVLITGASSGFGYNTVLKFQREGWNVVATMRSPEKDQELHKLDRVMVTRLDVKDRESIKAAVAETIEKFGSLDALVNNAGYGVAGFLEEASDEDIDNQIDTNLKGVILVTQEVLPQMRKQKSGSIVNVTSVGGSIGLPMIALYNATKFAVEGLTESLRIELEQFGISACSVAPGAFKTGFGHNSNWLDGNAKPELDGLRESFQSHYSAILAQPPKPFGFGDPKDVADLIYNCVTGTPSHRNFIGKDAKMLTFLRRFLPQKAMDKMFKDSILPKGW